MSGKEIAINFFQAYLAAPIVVIMYIGYKLWYRPKIQRTRDMNLWTGKREMNVKNLLMEERMERKAWPRWKKVYKFLC